MIHLDTLSTLVAATLVLLLGRKLVHSVSFLKKYTIPEPVAGGLLVALALLVLKKSMGWEIDFDMSLKDPLMLAFFATIGLNANLASLRSGGKVLGVFLIVVVGLLLMQNAIGIGMATLPRDRRTDSSPSLISISLRLDSSSRSISFLILRRSMSVLGND